MPKINVTDINGQKRAIEYESGSSLMELLRDEGYDEILAICGGGCSCATCHVHIQAEHMSKLPEVEEDEQMLIELTDNFDPQQSRLSCQIELNNELAGLSVTIIETD